MTRNCAHFNFQPKYRSPRRQKIECMKYLCRELRNSGINYKFIIHKREETVSRILIYKESLLDLCIMESSKNGYGEICIECTNVIKRRWQGISKLPRPILYERNYPTEALVKFLTEAQNILENDSRFSNVTWMTDQEYNKDDFGDDIPDEYYQPSKLGPLPGFNYKKFN